MRLTNLLCLPLLLALVATAGAQSEKPHHFYRDKKWLAGAAFITTVAVLDVVSTRYAQRRGAAENGWDAKTIIGPHPSLGATVGYGAGEAALGLTFHWAAWKLEHDDPSRAWRTIAYTSTPVTWGVFGGRAIYGNFTYKQAAVQPRQPLIVTR